MRYTIIALLTGLFKSKIFFIYINKNKIFNGITNRIKK